MQLQGVTPLDRALAAVCRRCPVCRRARRRQRGWAYRWVRQVEGTICPFCQAYLKVYKNPAHAPMIDAREQQGPSNQ